MPKKTVAVPAISCDHCVRTIERELSGLEGVTAVSAEASAQRVTVEWTEAGTDWNAIRTFLEEIGYPPAGEAGGGGAEEPAPG
ncbi:MAG TPA: heavy-metal-associated domain-containing protein [Thermoanaerobaculia bacterium]|nr:heavy-metal-associated domain-containing protein [Thermoanaerobaculia bacterium]